MSRFIKERNIPSPNSRMTVDTNGDRQDSYKRNGSGLINLSQIESGDLIIKSIDELIELVGQIKPEHFRRIEVPIYYNDLSTELKYMIDRLQAYDDTAIKNEIEELKKYKANVYDLLNYRRKDVLIEKSDLSKEVQDILFAIQNGGYDDREIKAEIELLKEIKMNKIDEVRFRKVDEPITLDDLDTSVRDLLGIISENVGIIQELQELKADRSELNNYRHKGVLITYHDLDSSLKTIIDNMENFDDSSILLKINELEKKKANKADLDTKADLEELALYRKKEVAIEFEDLSEHLQSLLDDITPDFNPVDIQDQINELRETKIDLSELENYRPKSVLIGEKDLTEELYNKIQSINSEQNLTEVWESINNLEETKANLSDLSAYLLNKNNVITKDHLDAQLQLLILNKVDLAQLNDYRRKDILIELDDLSEEIKDLLGSQGNGECDLSEITSRIEAINEEITSIQGDLANKLDSNSADTLYRKKDVLINELDLSPELKEKINSLPSDVNLVEITNKVNFLTGEVTNLSNTKLSEDDADELYRRKDTVIEEVDLSEELQEKLNNIVVDHTNLTNQNGNDEYRHISTEEYNKFLSYESTINNLIKRIVLLEKETGLQVEPIILSSSLDSIKENVPLETSIIELTLNSTDVSIINTGKISMTPNCIQGEPRIEEDKLIINISSLEEETDYTLTVLEDALQSGDLTNTTPYTLRFKTEVVTVPPVLQHSSLNGKNNVPLSTDKIVIPFVYDGEITIENKHLVTLSNDAVIDSVEVVGTNIEISISSLTETTEYTLTISNNVVKGDNGLYAEELVEQFTTEDVKTKPVISNCNIHTNTNVELTLPEIVFEVSTEESLVLNDRTKVVITPTVNHNVDLRDGDKLVITFNENLKEDTLYNVGLKEGLLKDGDDLVNDELINYFRTIDVKTKPVLTDMEEINGTSIESSKSVLKIGVSAEERVVLSDVSRITLSPDHTSGAPELQDNVITIPVTLKELTDYTLTIYQGAVQDGDDLFNDEFSIEFNTNEDITEPRILSCNLNGNNQVPLETRELIFEVDVKESLVIESQDLITITPNVKNGEAIIREKQLVVPMSNLKETTEYTATIGVGALRDGDDLTNSTPFTATFTTLDVLTKPTIKDSELNNEINVPISTTEIEFNVLYNESLIIADDSKIKIMPDIRNGLATTRGNTLTVPVSNLQETTEYTITIEEGAIQDGNDLFNDELVNTFITEDVQNKPIIENCSINGQVVDHTTLNEIVFNVTCEEELILENSSLVTCNHEIINEVSVEGKQLKLSLHNLELSTVYTITIGEGTLRNGDDLVNDELVNTFTTKGETSNIEWEYEVTLSGIENDHIKYTDIEQAVGISGLTDALFYSSTEEEFEEGIISENPKHVVEYWGAPAYPLEEGMRIPRDGIDDGGECPNIERPSHIPAGFECYTLGSVIPDLDGLYFTSGPAVEHVIKVRSYNI